jgi:2-polyprenyl-6-methoxyphenol hydroxylase-like FAD-dependent oxidoreductase
VASIVVCGGGIVGLSAGMMLAQDGHQVTVLEADPAPPPADAADAWGAWERQGVVQFRLAHTLLPGARKAMDAELPGLTEQLLAAGCSWFDLLEVQPPGVTDRDPRPDDDSYRVPTGRRPVLEAVFARAAERTPGVTVRRGTEIAGLLTGPQSLPGVPHVTGVRTTTGEELACALLIDATGRRTSTASWLTAVGARPPRVQSEDVGFVYYSRFYRGQMPAVIGPGVSAYGSFSLLSLHGDNDTWSLTFWAATGDAPMKELRHADVFTRVVQACPLQAHWVDGEPITDVLAMAGVLDSYRRFVVDGTPVVTGLAAVGDAWASTNPSAGRGISVGLLHAQALRQVVGEHLDDPARLAMAWDAITEERVTPFHRSQIEADRLRIAEMHALRDGTPLPIGDPFLTKMLVAAGRDADVFRAMIDMGTCLDTPVAVLARPGLTGRIEELGHGPRGALPGPDRPRLVELLTG